MSPSRNLTPKGDAAFSQIVVLSGEIAGSEVFEPTRPTRWPVPGARPALVSGCRPREDAPHRILFHRCEAGLCALRDDTEVGFVFHVDDGGDDLATGPPARLPLPVDENVDDISSWSAPMEGVGAQTPSMFSVSWRLQLASLLVRAVFVCRLGGSSCRSSGVFSGDCGGGGDLWGRAGHDRVGSWSSIRGCAHGSDYWDERVGGRSVVSRVGSRTFAAPYRRLTARAAAAAGIAAWIGFFIGTVVSRPRLCDGRFFWGGSCLGPESLLMGVRDPRRLLDLRRTHLGRRSRESCTAARSPRSPVGRSLRKLGGQN